jgi:hypothetical protein
MGAGTIHRRRALFCNELGRRRHGSTSALRIRLLS